MYDAIKNFFSQFSYDPKIENGWKKFGSFLVVGMGGSHLAADLLKVWNSSNNLSPERGPATAGRSRRTTLDLIIHSDYGLPALPERYFKDRLAILSSYSGNTEEVIDAFEEAGKRNLPRAVISTGGKLLELAKKAASYSSSEVEKHNEVPYIQIPDTGIQPRSAVGFMFTALLKMMGEEKALKEVSKLSDKLVPEHSRRTTMENAGPELSVVGEGLRSENLGKTLAKKLKGRVPVIYSSAKNAAIAQNWKVRFNETAKTPAFYNVFPELNHNEMIGFGNLVPDPALRGEGLQSENIVPERSRGATLANKFHFIFLKDSNDHPRIFKRMLITEKLFLDAKLPVETISLEGNNVFEKIFSSIHLADWTAYYLAKHYKVDPEQVALVEKFKGLMQ